MTENQIIAIAVISILAINLLWVVAQFVIYLVSRHSQSNDCLRVVYSKAFLVFCIIIEFVGNALTVWILAKSSVDNAPALGLIVFPFTGTVGITCSLNWQITVEDERLIYRNYLRSVKEYPLSQVTEIVLGLRGEVFICVGNEKIRVESCVTNREMLLTVLSRNGVPTKINMPHR